MYDKQTGSKWNHSTGLCMKGDLAGKQLKMMPTRMTLWKHWKKNFPDSKVLTGRKRGGMMGTYQRKELSSYGLSITDGLKSRLYPFKILKNNPVINDEFTSSQYLVVFDSADKMGFAFNRTLDGTTYSFTAVDRKRDGERLMKDEQTGSLWKRAVGKCIEGELKGKQLSPAVAVPWLIDRWKSIYQDNGSVYSK